MAVDDDNDVEVSTQDGVVLRIFEVDDEREHAHLVTSVDFIGTVSQRSIALSISSYDFHFPLA